MALTHGEFTLLREFVHHAGRVLSRDYLLNSLVRQTRRAVRSQRGRASRPIAAQDRAGPETTEPHRHRAGQRIQVRRSGAPEGKARERRARPEAAAARRPRRSQRRNAVTSPRSPPNLPAPSGRLPPTRRTWRRH